LRKKSNPENFACNATQTINKFFKNKFCDTEKKEVEDVEVYVTAFDIYDEYKQIQLKAEKER
jgi:hypothetical protein